MFAEFYYWMATRLSKLPTNDNPSYNAYFLIMILQNFNIVTIFILINHFAKIKFPKGLVILMGLSLTIILVVIDYISLYSRRNEIFKKCENFSPYRRRKGLIYFWLYVVLSITIFWTLAAVLVSPSNVN